MRNIKINARRVEVLSKTLIPITLFILVLKWFLGEFFTQISLSYNHYVLPPDLMPNLADISFLQKVLGFFVEGISIALLIYGLIQIIKLMKCFHTSEIFSASTIALFTLMSKIALLFVVYSPLKNSLLSVILTLHNPPGQRMLTLTCNLTDMVSIVMVGFLVVITSIVQEGYRVKMENDLTI